MFGGLWLGEVQTGRWEALRAHTFRPEVVELGSDRLLGGMVGVFELAGNREL